MFRSVCLGRAWLYMALGDHLLESYVNCYINNQTRVKKFYMKEALMLDRDQLQVLLTVSMGLEHVSFQLDVVRIFYLNVVK